MNIGTFGRRTCDVSPNGLRFTLHHDYFYSHITAKIAFCTDREVTFKDCRGNYATVDKVRNAKRWMQRHGFTDTDAYRFGPWNKR